MYQGMIAGAIGGFIGTWAMSEAQRLWTLAVDGTPPRSAGGRHDARDWQERSEHQNSNELAAQAAATVVAGRRLKQRELRYAAPFVHYAFGTAVGALYGAYAQHRRAHRSGAGFGTAVWLAADEIAMPLLGLSRSTLRRPFEMHLQSLAAHLVYGTTTEMTRRALQGQTQQRYSFRDKSVVITGGSRGLGLVMARQLAAEGAQLTLVARNGAELQRAADDIQARYPHIDVLLAPADVGDQSAVDRATAQVISRYGRIDVLINNAGIIQVGPLAHMKLSDFDDAMKTHFWGPLYFTLAVVPHMRRQGGGRIVNISSIGGRVAVPHLVPYSASKFALAGLSDGLRAELAPEGIVVTTVCPGLMRIGSPVNASFKGQRDREYEWFALGSATPITTIAAERAARQILSACRRGDAELIITLQAKLAVLARTIAPEWFADAMSLVQRLLPRAAGPDGDIAAPGRAADSRLAHSPLLAPMYAAARRNNELRRAL